MISYNYNQQMSPPSPFVHVTVRPPGGTTAVSDLPALLDTAADISVVPSHVAERLRLVPLDEVPIGGFEGRVSWGSTFLVELAIRQCEFRVIRIVAGRDEPHVL